MPGLEGVAPRVALRVRANPATSAAIEVEVVRRGVDELVTLLSDRYNVVGGDPNKYERIVAERRNVVL